MKKLILLLGNGLTIDLLSKFQKVNSVDLINLFAKGDTVIWPDGIGERGFLSYKHCPSLWNLGARPNMDKVAANDLIEDIITCANMISCADVVPEEDNIYINAYYELVAYLKHLFIQYNEEMDDKSLMSEVVQEWGWFNLIKQAYDSEKYEKIIIITYNYDIFLERILRLHHISFSVGGLEKDIEKIIILKPHGSISFIHNVKNEDSMFNIRKTKDMYEASLMDFSVSYSNLQENYLINAIIPPAGDSLRLTYKWASEVRELVENKLSQVSEKDQLFISGLSYWHVDRREIDEFLVKISSKNVNTYMINPNPPRALNAVLTCILPNHITYSSSALIGGIINE